jgi:iron complex outermembrane recepter protein
VRQQFEFDVGADNVRDNKPLHLAEIAASAGQGTDAGTCDALGRRYYADVRLKL